MNILPSERTWLISLRANARTEIIHISQPFKPRDRLIRGQNIALLYLTLRHPAYTLCVCLSYVKLMLTWGAEHGSNSTLV